MSFFKAAGCVIGQDYPRPIVDHDSIHKVNIGRHKAAYAKAKSESGQAQQSPEKKNNSSSKAKSSQSGKRKSETSSQSTSKITKFFAKK